MVDGMTGTTGKPSTTPLNPAHSIIERLGGRKFVSQETGIPEFTLRRWTQPIELSGTGGLIPSKRQPVLMELARRKGIALGRADFFGDDQEQDIRMAS